MAEHRLEGLPQRLQDFNDAYHRHDPDAMAALYAPDCRITLPGFELHGRAQAHGLWAAWFEAFPDCATDVLRVPSAPGLVALEWEERATHRGRLRVAGFDLSASGRTLCWRGVSLYALGEDGITSVTYHFDRLELVLQLMTVGSLLTSAPQGLRLWREARGTRLNRLTRSDETPRAMRRDAR